MGQTAGEKEVHEDQGNVMGHLSGVAWSQTGGEGGKNISGREVNVENQKNAQFIGRLPETHLIGAQPTCQWAQAERKRQPLAFA